METEKTLLSFLDENKVNYKVFRHDRRDTIEEKEALDKELGITAKHCKNILLTDRKKERFYLLVMPFEKTFRTSEVSKELSSSRLSFAPEDMLFDLLKCRSGALGTLALLFDEEGRVKLAVDRDLKSVSGLCMHPSVDTTTVTVDTDEYFGKLLPLLKHEPAFVTVTSENA